MSKVTIVDHPLINHKLTQIRQISCGSKDFREIVSEIGGLMAYEITRDLKTKNIEIETPICKMESPIFANDVIIVPILRAGLGMVEGIHNMIPTAKIGHIGLYRCEETLKPKEYFTKFPPNLETSTVLLVDPMLATGGSAIAAIDILKNRGALDIRFVGLVGCPEGVKALQKAHPDIDIYLSSCDERLNENGYIVPGLVDCGDRLFGTK